MFVPPARISLTISHHFSLLFIASGRSSVLHPISSRTCCMYVLAVRPAIARPYVGVHRDISLMSSSLLLQQCPACLVRLAWIVFVMEGRWPYSWCFVGRCLQDLFNIAFHIIDSLSIAVHVFVSRVSMSFSVDETLLPRKVNLSTHFRELPSSVEM